VAFHLKKNINKQIVAWIPLLHGDGLTVMSQNGHQLEAIWTDSQNTTQWQIIEIKQPTDR